MISAELENSCNIILTRTEDTELDIPAKTADGNHFKADLFISIHAGGAFFTRQGAYISVILQIIIRKQLESVSYRENLLKISVCLLTEKKDRKSTS